MKNKKNYFLSLISHLSSRKGFTLIELMVVISVTAVLGTLGIAGFTSYNQNQVLQTSANEVMTMLNLAKSRAQSQVKLGIGTCTPLNGYGVEIVHDVINKKDTYALKIMCNGIYVSEPLETKILPKDVSFDASGTFFFPIQTGQAEGPESIRLSNGSQEKYIVINRLGGVSAQSSLPIPTSTPTPTPTPTVTPTPTLGASPPPPTQLSTMTLAFSNPNNPNIWSWSAAIYNFQTKVWESSATVKTQFLVGLAPSDVDADLAGTTFLFKITEYAGGIFEYGPYLVTIPDPDVYGRYGAYTWNSALGSISSPGQATHLSIAINNSSITGTVTNHYYVSYVGYRGTVKIVSIQDVPPGALKYFEGAEVSANISNVPVNNSGYWPVSLLEPNRPLVGNLSFVSLLSPSWGLNLLHYATDYPPAVFSGSYALVGGNTVFSVSGNISTFPVVITVRGPYNPSYATVVLDSFSVINGIGSPHTVTGNVNTYCVGGCMEVHMYANSDPEASNSHPWNVYTWRMENWQRVF